jgi:hypothetical protein
MTFGYLSVTSLKTSGILTYFKCLQLVFIFNKFSGIYFLSLENKRILNVFDHLPQHSEIVYSEKNENELKNVTESNERSGCLIYQSEKKMTY